MSTQVQSQPTPAKPAEVTPAEAPKPAEVTLTSRFGSGRYFSVQCEMFKDTQRIFNIPEDKAEKIAKAFATSLGAIMSTSQVTFKGLDKLNKDGGLKSLSEISKVKDLPLTREIAMLRAITYVNSATSNHVKVVAQLDDTLADWVKGL